MGEAEQDCDKGTTAACSSPEESQALKDVKEAEPDLLYKKLPRFIALKTHNTLEA